jgi:hypothetical protein
MDKQIVELSDKAAKPMKIITLCGSTRFREIFEDTNRQLTLEGNIVISCGVWGWGDPVTEEQKILLDEIHFRKIDLSDEIFVINHEFYIGESTRREIAYAKSKKKPVNYLNKVIHV